MKAALERHTLRYFEFEQIAVACDGMISELNKENSEVNKSRAIRFIYAENLKDSAMRLTVVRGVSGPDGFNHLLIDDRLRASGKLTRQRGAEKQKRTSKIDKDKRELSSGHECNPYRYVLDGLAAAREADFSDNISSCPVLRDENLIGVVREGKKVQAIWQHEHNELAIRNLVTFDSALDDVIIRRDVCLCFKNRPFKESPSVIVEVEWVRSNSGKIVPVTINMIEYNGHAGNHVSFQEYRVRCLWLWDENVPSVTFKEEDVGTGRDALYKAVAEGFRRDLSDEARKNIFK